MGYLNERELAAIREEVLYFLPDTCTIKRKTNTIDSSGNVIETWTESSAIYCRVIMLEKLEGVFGGVAFERELSKSWYQAYVPYNTTVDVGDIFVKAGEEFSIVRVFDDQTYPLVKQLVIVDMQGGIT